MISNEQYDYLRNHPAFEHLSQEAFNQLAQHVRFRKISKGQIFFYAEDPRDSLVVLFRGYARIEHYDETDTFVYFDYVRQGGAFPFGDMFQNKPYRYTAVAKTDLECLIVPMDLFEQVSQKNPQQLVYISQKLSNILSFQELRLRNTMRPMATDRVIQTLSLLYRDLCLPDQLLILPFEIQLQELARLAATTRETVGHVIKKLKDEGRIRYEHKRLTYLDLSYFLEIIGRD